MMDRNTKIGLGIAGGTIFIISGIAGAFDEPPAESEASASASPTPSAERAEKPDKPEQPSGYVTAKDVDPWPLTVNSGVLDCHNDAVTIKVNSTVYGINGTATSRDGHSKIDPVWADDEELIDELEDAGADIKPDNTPKVPIGELIDHGLKLCD